jgi:hypothetical protein
LEKAKRSGKAFLCVAGRNTLPTPFQVTGDPRWDTGGDLWTAYDLQLGDGGGDDDRVLAVTENIISGSAERCDSDDNQAGVKLLSEKTNDEIKKMMKAFRENQSAGDSEGPIGDQLFQEFGDILSVEGIGAIN